MLQAAELEAVPKAAVAPNFPVRKKIVDNVPVVRLDARHPIPPIKRELESENLLPTHFMPMYDSVYPRT